MTRPSRASSDRFDESFYRRYYGNPRTRVTSPRESARRARLIGGLLTYHDVRVRTILDAGCGLGLLRAPLLAEFPAARYAGLEVSEYLCRRHGWIEGSLASFTPARPFDLVVCDDVLQYLEDADAAAAMRNLPRLTRQALYFSTLTSEDWKENCDRRRTDRNVHLRPAGWYLRRLRGAFQQLGPGVWVRREIEVVRWELEK